MANQERDSVQGAMRSEDFAAAVQERKRVLAQIEQGIQKADKFESIMQELNKLTEEQKATTSLCDSYTSLETAAQVIELLGEHLRLANIGMDKLAGLNR
jgi:iron-sulfur cluster repair protein YtfE (RIC family)